MIKNIGKTFGNAISSIINNPRSILPVVCGVNESVLAGISNRYILEITADLGGNALGFGPGEHEFTIHAYLQDKIQFNSRSAWTGIIQDVPGASELEKIADSLAQATTGVSAISTASTQRKWSGSDPISLSLKLKFEAINNVYNEVLLPCQVLQGLTLPRGGVLGVGLIPPGPSPYTFTQDPSVALTGIRGERISVNIGGFFGLSSVIVKSVKVTYENRMSVAGPIGAEVDLEIESWRMMTREELQAAYTEKMTVPGGNNAIGIV